MPNKYLVDVTVDVDGVGSMIQEWDVLYDFSQRLSHMLGSYRLILSADRRARMCQHGSFIAVLNEQEHELCVTVLIPDDMSRV